MYWRGECFLWRAGGIFWSLEVHSGGLLHFLIEKEKYILIDFFLLATLAATIPVVDLYKKHVSLGLDY